MRKYVKSKKGVTLVELIITIALLVTVLVPMCTGYINVLIINKLSKTQLSNNAIIRVVKENISTYIHKPGTLVPELSGTFPNYVENRALFTNGTSFQNGISNIVIKKSNGVDLYPNYKYDVVYDGNDSDASIKIIAYKVTVRNLDNKFISTFITQNNYD